MGMWNCEHRGSVCMLGGRHTLHSKCLFLCSVTETLKHLCWWQDASGGYFLCLSLLCCCQSREHCRQAHEDICTCLFISLPHLNSWEPIEKYINEQYEKFLKEEVNIARKKRIPDTRVHCCLYFISPTGHSYVHHPSSFLTPLMPLWQIYTLHCSISAMDPQVLPARLATV